MANKSIPTTLLVKQVGNYLYKHLDGAYRKTQSGNQYNIYMMVYYQVPLVDREFSDETNDVQEMKIHINVTSYSNKLRINIIEISPNEFTIGSIIVPADKAENSQDIVKKINQKVRKSLEKHYEEYDFIF